MLHGSLTCSAVTVNLVKISSNTVIATHPAEGPGSTCNVTLTVSENASSSDGGQYKCHVQLSYSVVFVFLKSQIVLSIATLYILGELLL